MSMSIRFKKHIEELEYALNKKTKTSSLKGRHLFGKKIEFLNAKQRYEEKNITKLVEKIQLETNKLLQNIDRNNLDKKLIDELFKITSSDESMIKGICRLKEIAELLPDESETSGSLSFPKPRQMPADIRDEVMADISELSRCFDNRCYRACVIICARIMEVCLHRKYYEATGIDLLEKNPGMGLGKLIAKMAEKGIQLDPGLTQQIHLINQVRIYSVHKKSESFYPSRSQAYAMILYTMDILEKIF